MLAALGLALVADGARQALACEQEWLAGGTLLASAAAFDAAGVVTPAELSANTGHGLGDPGAIGRAATGASEHAVILWDEVSFRRRHVDVTSSSGGMSIVVRSIAP